MRLLDGEGGNLDVVELVEAAIVGEGLPGPQRANYLRRLLESLGSGGAVDAESVQLALAVADPQAHDRPPAGHRVHGCCFLRDVEGMVQGQQQDDSRPNLTASSFDIGDRDGEPAGDTLTGQAFADTTGRAGDNDNFPGCHG